MLIFLQNVFYDLEINYLFQTLKPNYAILTTIIFPRTIINQLWALNVFKSYTSKVPSMDKMLTLPKKII